MRRAERLFRIMGLLRGGRVLTARQIGAALEVSERTIYRDIAHLQASGVPIDGAAGFGYVAGRGYELPAFAFTHEQVEALALGAAFVIAAGDPDLARAAAEARAKLEAALPEARAGALEASPLAAIRRASGKARPVAALFRRAIRERLPATFAYEALDGARSHRRVRPLAITAATDCWLLGAWDEEREAFRDFRLDRIGEAAVGAEPVPHEPGRDLAGYLAHHRALREAVERDGAR